MRERAEACRAQAERIIDIRTRYILVETALTWERLAKLKEQREVRERESSNDQ